MSYWVYRTIALLPLWLTHALAPSLAWLLRNLFRYRVDTVRENLRRSFPELSDQQRQKISKNFYRQLVESALEIVHGHKMSLSDFKRRVKIINPEVAVKASHNGTRSVVILVIHQGNWEWLQPVVSSQLEVPIDPIYKPLHDRGADRFMYESRSRFGGEPITAASAARDVLKKRRQTRFIAILADQSPGKRDRMHWSPILHQETAWFTGAATIARLIKSPILFAQCKRRRRGHYELRFHEITDNAGSLEEAEIIDAYAQCTERAIRDQPESYLWSNRRWKRQGH